LLEDGTYFGDERNSSKETHLIVSLCLPIQSETNQTSQYERIRAERESGKKRREKSERERLGSVETSG